MRGVPQGLGCVCLSVTPRAVARRAPPSTGFSGSPGRNTGLSCHALSEMLSRGFVSALNKDIGVWFHGMSSSGLILR